MNFAKESVYTQCGEYRDFRKLIREREENARWEPVRLSECELRTTDSVLDMLEQHWEGLDEKELVDDFVDNGTWIGVKIKDEIFPLRNCGILSVLDRAKLEGSITKNLYRNQSASPAKASWRKAMVELINESFKLEGGPALVRIADRKVSAIHSSGKGAYVVFPVDELLDKTQEYFFREFPNAEFCGGEFTHETISWNYSLAEYSEDICKGLEGTILEGYEPYVRFQTSDIGIQSVTLTPMLKSDYIARPMNASLKIDHRGNNSMENFTEALRMIYARFKEGIERFRELEEIIVTHPYECMLNIMRKACIKKELGVKVAKEFREFNGDEPCSALEIYTAICDVLLVLSRTAKGDVLRYFREEDCVSRCLALDFRKYDTAESVWAEK